MKCPCLKCLADEKGLLHSWGIVLKPHEYARVVADITAGEEIKPIYYYEDWQRDMARWQERRAKERKQ